MADYNPNTVSAYQQYASSMSSSGGGSNMSGLGSRSTTSGTPSSRFDSKGYTPTKSTSTKSGIAYIEGYGDDNDNIPMTPEQIYTAAAQATTEVGGFLVPTIDAPMIHAANLYSMPNMVQQVSDYVYRADRDTAVREAISGAQAEEQASVDAAISSINRAITQGKTDAEIAEAFLNDMGGMGSDKPDESGGFGVPGVTLEDVTDTQQGLMTNPQPLYDFADEMANPSITTTELPPISADQKEKLGAKLREASDKGDLSSVMNQLAQDSKIQLSSAVTNFIEGAETQVASNDDVTPERQDPSFWDRVLFGGEAETPAVDPETGQQIQSADDVANEGMADMASQGLMSRRMDGKDGDMSMPTQYGTAVFEMGTDLKKVEGTEPHIGEDWENVTLALGIVPTSGLKIDGKTVPSDRAKRGKWLKSNGYVSSNGKPTNKFKSATIDTSGAVKDGIKRSDYTSDTAWSAAVINNFKEGAQDKVEGFDELGIAEQKAVIDIAWNMGVGGLDYSGNQSLIGELSKAPEDRSISTMLEAGKHVTEGGKVMRGLARRKALAVNELIDDPAEKITKIRQLSVGSRTYHTYINAAGEEVKTIKLGQKHKGSPDGIIDVATGDEVVGQEDLDYSSVVVRPMLRPTE